MLVHHCIQITKCNRSKATPIDLAHQTEVLYNTATCSFEQMIFFFKEIIRSL
jgi:hypothetical protein